MIPKKFAQKKQSVFRITILLIALALWAVVTPVTAFFWSVFLVWWVFRLDSRILGGVAIGFLVLIPVMQYFKADARAEQVAVYVYFLLVMVVTLQIIEFRREGRAEVVPEDLTAAAVKSKNARHAKAKPIWF